MARDFEHFVLPPWNEPQKKRPGTYNPPESNVNRYSHSRELLTNLEQLENNVIKQSLTAPKGINPLLVFKIKMRQGTTFDENKLNAMGLRLLAKDADKAIVVFPDGNTLSKIRGRIEAYGGLVDSPYTYEDVDDIEEIAELSAEDRTGPKLKTNPLKPGEVVALDIELFHGGDVSTCFKVKDEIDGYLRTHDLKITDYIFNNEVFLFLIRAKVNLEALNVLLNNFKYIFEIDRRAEPTFEMLPITNFTNNEDVIKIEIVANPMGVLIIDSGVTKEHPLLSNHIVEAEVFPDRLKTKITGSPSDGDTVQGGHGTAVAGIAIYGDLYKCIIENRFVGKAHLYSARVTDQFNQYDEDELLEHQLQNAVDYFLQKYTDLKVINISHGDPALICQDNQKQFRFAAAIDRIAYLNRNKNIIFVISSGNIELDDELNAAVLKQQYPEYLLNHKQVRLIDPATSALALTVGGLSNGSGIKYATEDEKANPLIAGVQTWPSPFTRIGLGVGGAIKPDVVDYAGDWYFNFAGKISPGGYGGIPTTSKDFAPPEGKVFSLVSGTSYSAPRVASLAAQLFSEFPSASSNLIRALIASSALIPESRPGSLAKKETTHKDILKIYGYGQPNFDRARRSGQNDVLLLEDNEIEINNFRIFQLPPLPPEFFNTKGNGGISVTLAFDPPTRRTRMDNYLEPVKK